jgi:hypothetical protein
MCKKITIGGRDTAGSMGWTFRCSYPGWGGIGRDVASSAEVIMDGSRVDFYVYATLYYTTKRPRPTQGCIADDDNDTVLHYAMLSYNTS